MTYLKFITLAFLLSLLLLLLVLCFYEDGTWVVLGKVTMYLIIIIFGQIFIWLKSKYRETRAISTDIKGKVIEYYAYQKYKTTVFDSGSPIDASFYYDTILVKTHNNREYEVVYWIRYSNEELDECLLKDNGVNFEPGDEVELTIKKYPKDELYYLYDLNLMYNL